MPEQPTAAIVVGSASGDISVSVGNRLTTRVRWLLTRWPVRWGFLAATIGLCLYTVAREWNSVRIAIAGIGVVPILAALVAALVAMLAAMRSWRTLLAALGSPLPIRAAAGIVFVGQLGKYLPGSVWPVLAQMELANAHQVPRHRSATASVLAMLMSLFAGLLAALVTLPFVLTAPPYRLLLLAVPVMLLCLHPKVLNPALRLLLRLARRADSYEPLGGRAVLVALGWALLSWLAYGLQIWLLAVRLGAPEGRTALLAVGGFALAWSVGFVVVLAPAGAGVRDVLLVAILGTVLGVADATAVALVSRLLMTAGDLLAAAVAAFLARQRRSNATEQAKGL
ncbi:MAG TPA: lysylphosphatidylglycerol synthase domain-containing protein [Pseudonocardiaceae bacterium]|jgi:hypothetical protein|nr:lysylphosphatidylglycerol synthase domain-containing protein [Pseudonocardiaceae bacterium]